MPFATKIVPKKPLTPQRVEINPTPFNAKASARDTRQTLSRRSSDSTVQDVLDVAEPWLDAVPIVSGYDQLNVNTQRLEPVIQTPVGDIYASPNEAVSPLDCELWPNSPYCNVEDAWDPTGFIGGQIDVYVGANETVVTLTGTLAWTTLPPMVISYRRRGYEGFNPYEALPPDKNGENDNKDGQGNQLEPLEMEFDEPVDHDCWYWILNMDDYNNEHDNSILPTLAVLGPVTWGGNSVMGRIVTFNLGLPSHYLYYPGQKPWNPRKIEGRHRVFKATWANFALLYGHLTGNVYNAMRYQLTFTIFRNEVQCENLGPRVPPYIPGTGKRPPMGCECKKEIDALGRSINSIGKLIEQLQETIEEWDERIEEIEKVVGVEEFPVSLPTLTGDSTTNAKNHIELHHWTARNIDAVNGFWPIKVPYIDGKGKEKAVTINDQSEAAYEMFGILSSIAEDANVAMQIGARNSVELIQTKTLASQIGALITSLVKFCGFKTTQKAKKLKIGFSPSKTLKDGVLDNREVEEYLTPSEWNYKITQLDEEVDLLEILERVLENTEMSRASIFRKVTQVGKGFAGFTGEGIVQEGTSASSIFEQEWEKYLDSLRKRGVDFDETIGSKKDE